jgi:putative hydrolase of the HAD superfamily
MRAEAVCFDLDDTLYDYHEYARAGLDAAADRLEAHTGRRFHDELHALYFDESVTEGTFDRLAERHGIPEKMIDELIEAYHNADAPLSPYPETREVLSALETHSLGLVTDGRGGHAKLDRLGLREFFDAVLVTPTVDASKREPWVFEEVLSTLSTQPERAVYVGDDPRVDFRAPNELGIVTVRLRRGRHADREPQEDLAAPDHEIEQLEGLLALLDCTAARE